MKAHIKLGRVFGIQLGLHLSWFLIGLLVTLSLAFHFSSVNPGWGPGVIWATAIVTGVLFFAGVVLHELAHALVARLRGLPVRNITLFALGGVALIEKESADASTEFWMGIAGPIMSVLIGVLCLFSAFALGWSPETEMTSPATPVMASLVWLGYINIALAIFNMLPGFPLDGGRVLRSIVWKITGDVSRATRIAARVGQFVAILFIVWGLFQFFFGLGFSGLWLAFIGWFLLNAAGSSYAHVEISENLRDVRVADVMREDYPLVDAHTPLQTFVDEHLLTTGRRCYLVADGDRTVGIITPHEVARIPPVDRSETSVLKAMRPFDTLEKIGPDAPLTEALEAMGKADVNQLPVVSDDGFIGIVSRRNILDTLQMRRDLQI